VPHTAVFPRAITREIGLTHDQQLKQVLQGGRKQLGGLRQRRDSVVSGMLAKLLQTLSISSFVRWSKARPENIGGPLKGTSDEWADAVYVTLNASCIAVIAIGFPVVGPDRTDRVRSTANSFNQ
jgi:hypothetical protein